MIELQDELDVEIEMEYEFDQDFDQDFDEKEEKKPDNQKYIPSQEIALKNFAKSFHEDVIDLAKGYMQGFFEDKTLHCGGNIPRSLLLTHSRISTVLNYDIIKGVEVAYEALELHMKISNADLETSKASGEVTEDIKLVNETLNLLSRCGIPQQFAGGMLCLYLELIEGVSFG